MGKNYIKKSEKKNPNANQNLSPFFIGQKMMCGGKCITKKKNNRGGGFAGGWAIYKKGKKTHFRGVGIKSVVRNRTARKSENQPYLGVKPKEQSRRGELLLKAPCKKSVTRNLGGLLR